MVTITKATVLGKTCATCDWFEINVILVGKYDHEATIECGRFRVSWYTDLSPIVGTEYEAGLSWCPAWKSTAQPAPGEGVG